MQHSYSMKSCVPLSLRINETMHSKIGQNRVKLGSPPNCRPWPGGSRKKKPVEASVGDAQNSAEPMKEEPGALAKAKLAQLKKECEEFAETGSGLVPGWLKKELAAVKDDPGISDPLWCRVNHLESILFGRWAKKFVKKKPAIGDRD